MAQPETFGRYRVVRHLGSGTFATVWLAHDDLLDTPVAIKVLAENWARRLDIHQRFLEEARILRQADSNWLVRVHDLDVLPDERPYMVMTYADQGSVADLATKGPLPLDEALRLLTEIGQGVTVLHRHGTIHRDIKPSNVLLESSPVGQRVLVADLGFAKSIDEASGFTAAAGTPGYMSPEQSGPGGDIDVRADVYSLGAVAYELITGRHPPAPPVRVPPRRLRPDLPPALNDLIMSALAEYRTARPSDAKTFTDRVRAIRMAPDLPRGVPWWLRFARVVRRGAASLAGAALVLAATTGAAGQPTLRLIEATDPSGRISTVAPIQWTEHLQSHPTAQTGDPTPDPGLLIATNPGQWHSAERDVYGVYATLPGEAGRDPDTLAESVPCSGTPERHPVTGERWRGEVWNWPDCGGPGAFSAAAVHPPGGGETLYMEVRQPVNRPDMVEEIIAHTRMRS